MIKNRIFPPHHIFPISMTSSSLENTSTITCPKVHSITRGDLSYLTPQMMSPMGPLSTPSLTRAKFGAHLPMGCVLFQIWRNCLKWIDTLAIPTRRLRCTTPRTTGALPHRRHLWKTYLTLLPGTVRIGGRMQHPRSYLRISKSLLEPLQCRQPLHRANL